MGTHVPSIDFRHLSNFVQTCQSSSVTSAASKLNLATSSLSSSLRALEEQVEIKLFRRIGRHLYLLPSANWLFHWAVKILHEEAYARSMTQYPSDKLHVILVEFRLKTSIGLVSKALVRAIADMREAHPDLRIDYRFANESGFRWITSQEPHPNPRQPDIIVGYELEHPPSSIGANSIKTLLADHWVTVGAALDGTMENDSALPSTETLSVMKLGDQLIASLVADAELNGYKHRLRFLDELPIALPTLIAENPGTRFILPRSMLTKRLGMSGVAVQPHSPELSADIQYRVGREDDAAIIDFIEAMRWHLENPDDGVIFQPQMTYRQLRYFNQTSKCGSIAAASRAEKVAQPAMSTQIRKLEKVMQGPLFVRQSSGLEPTQLGDRLRRHAQLIESGVDRLFLERQDIASNTQSRLTIGLLPSSGHDSLMTEGVAKALTRFSKDYPECHLSIIEASSSELHQDVSNKVLNFAIVGNAQPQMARISIGKSEKLSLVANKSLGLEAIKRISLSEISQLPLILAPRNLSMHAAALQEAANQKLTLKSVLEIGSVPLLIAMLRQAPLCTILPASAVRADLANGTVTATPVVEEFGQRQLLLIYSTERTLSNLERSLISFLREAFQERSDRFGQRFDLTSEPMPEMAL
ncbi:LysR substrate-binding domain-containing protein [uncultured Cohaesibacter sp.]|uniref:LysR substrate-binding domain-containing protein n=1 Tax=uncultured Cohaesibacter sp. TaxID=1002546 RepID=UPI0029C8C0EF|nr:LysR substrate-binding domain-containing protein [uncultured Cohaesibacter sp.]